MLRDVLELSKSVKMEKSPNLLASLSEENTDHEAANHVVHSSRVLMTANTMSEQNCEEERDLECSHEQTTQESLMDTRVSSGNKSCNSNVAYACGVNSTTDNFSLKYYEEIKNYLLSVNFPDTNYKRLLKKRAKHYSIKDGELYYGNKVVLMTEAEQLEMLSETHQDKKTGIHLGVKKMSHIINSKCFWRGQYIDIANFVRQCRKCTELAELSCSRKNSEIDFVDEDSELDCTRIWQRVEIYLHGPFVNENGETVYISAVVDTVSHYVLAKCLLENNVSSHLAGFLLEVFCVFGIVKCYLSRTCKQYLEQIKEAFKSKSNMFQKMSVTLSSSLEDLVFVLPDGEEKCSWIIPSVETFTSNYTSFSETDLYIFILKLNVKTNQSSPFMKMFNRLPFSSSEEDKENANINLGSTKKTNSGRRILRSSVLQCRHCQEVFTSKISFRIHQRTHTDEARKRGLLDGQVKYVGERDRKIFRRPLLRHKYLALRRRSSLSSENSLQASVTDCRSSSIQVPERHRAELRANTVEAVRRLLANSSHKRKRRGKYKKFPLEIQDQMARYAIEKGNLMAVQHFSDKLGVIVSESTIRNIVKCYQNFTPDVRREIGQYASLYGLEATVTHYSEKLGRELKFGLIRKFKNQYLSQNPKTNVLKVESSKVVEVNVNESAHLKDVASYSSDMRDMIGQYACDHPVSGTIDFFSKKFNLHLNEFVVQRFKKDYQHKQRTNVSQLNLSQGENEQQLAHHHHQQHQQQQQEHPLLLQQEPSSEQQTLPPIIPLPVQEQQLQSQGHLLIHPHHHPQLTLFNNDTLQDGQQPNLELHEKHQDLPQCNPQHSEALHHDTLSVGTGVTLLPVHHQTNTNSPNLHEGSIQSSGQTIDILQSSLNLLNNPQMNNPTTIIYNPSYQLTSTSNIPSNQVIPINQQQNPQITFQAANQCTDTNIQPTLPLSYRSQEVPISASVIINQNVSTIQTFPNGQVYPAFSQPPPVQSNVLTVSDHSMPLTQPVSQASSLSEERQPLSSSGLPAAITLAVAPVPEQHFQPNANHPPAVVLSQPVSQPILISHTQTLLQHLIDPQAHLNPVPQHLMGEIHSRQATSSQSYPSVVDQEPHSQVFPQKLNCCLPQDQFETSSLLGGGRETINVELSGSHVKNEKSAVNFNSLPNLNGVESQNVSETELSSTSFEVEGKESDAQSITVEVLQSSGSENSAGPMCHPMKGSKGAGHHRQPSSEKTHKKKPSKRGGRKKGSKEELKSGEQKRGTYATYSPEIRAEMGKYAAEYGSQKACDFFRSTHGFKVAESTMRGLRDKYLRKRAMCSDDGNEVTSLGYAPRGRPMRLGKYDEFVQECIKDLVKAGEKITSYLAIATAKHVLMQYEPCLLEENGGKIRLNVTWAKSFLKRSGIRN